VLHRKNALFYRTLHGSEAGDLFMSLIDTCELAGRQSVRLPHRASAARTRAGGQSLGVWMPWNYRETLARLATPAAA
jgi:hypothetical protein